MGLELQQVEEEVGAGHRVPAQQQAGEPEPTGGTRSCGDGELSCRRVSAGDQAVDEVGQSGVEGDDLVRVGPLLGPVDSGCSVRPGQWVLYVTGDDDLGSAPVGQSGEVDGVDPPERATLGRHRLPCLVPEDRAENRGGPHRRRGADGGSAVTDRGWTVDER